MLIKTIKRFIKIAGFKGYVAHKDLAKSIIAPPYDTLDSSEARILAHKNPMSFLRVNKPEIDLEPDLDPYSSLVYQKGLKNIQEFIRNR